MILTKEDYDMRMNQLIEDSKFIEISSDPLKDINNMVRSELLRLENQKLIERKTRFSLLEANPVLPRLYGLPKIHKAGNKMRPIVSNVKAPTYKIAKYLVRKFEEIGLPANFEVKNSYEAAKKLNGLKLQDDEMLVSFDVVSLFPNVPLEESLQMLEEFLFEKGIKGQELQKLMSLTELCMNNSHFQFRGKFFKLRDGVAMGNPLSPFITSIFMSAFENDFKKHPLFPKIWIRYVDDIFAVVRRTKLRQTLKYLNETKWKSLQFTIERE